MPSEFGAAGGRRREAEPIIVHGGVGLRSDRKDRIVRVGGEKHAIDAELFVFQKQLRKMDLDAQGAAKAKSIYLENKWIRSGRVPAGYFGMGKQPLIVAANQHSLVGDDIEGVMRLVWWR
jgi:hypothetical protein